MSNLAGTNVASMIVPFTSDDKYATGDSNYIKGGRHSVNTVLERNSIFKERRTVGMHCFVKEDGKTYELINNPDTDGTKDQDWKIFSGADKKKTYVFVNDRVVDGVSKLEFFHDGDGVIKEVKANFPSETQLTEDFVLAIDVLVDTEWKEAGAVTIPVGKNHVETIFETQSDVSNKYVRQRIISKQDKLTNLVVKVTIS